MKAEIVNVTPQMASDWLKRNTDNRPLYRTVVNGFKAALQRGEYIQTHQGIAFDEDGILMDGQHRLTAISELRDGLFPMLVTWGVPRSAFKVMDIGLKRSAADSLREDRRVVEVARVIAIMCDNKRGSITPTQLIPVIERVRQLHDCLVAFCASTTKTWSSAPVRAAAVVSMMNGIDGDYVKTTYRALVLQDFGGMTPAAHALVRNVNNGTARAGDVYDMFARCMIVFDPKHAENTKIQIKDTGKYSAIVRARFAGTFTQSDAPKKKAANESAAKGVIGANYTGLSR